MDQYPPTNGASEAAAIAPLNANAPLSHAPDAIRDVGQFTSERVTGLKRTPQAPAVSFLILLSPLLEKADRFGFPIDLVDIFVLNSQLGAELRDLNSRTPYDSGVFMYSKAEHWA